MAAEFKLPDLGEGIHEAEILEVKVSAGQTVEEDQPILEVETDKAVVEIPSPVAGVVEAVHVKSGQTVKVGTVLISFLTPAGTTDLPLTPLLGQNSGAPTEGSTTSAPIKDRSPAGTTTSAPASNGRQTKDIMSGLSAPGSTEQKLHPTPAAPAVRRLAREIGVDLARCHGSGPAGRVLKEDVLQCAAGTNNVSKEMRVPDTIAPLVQALSAEPVYLPDFSKFGLVDRVPLKSIRRKIAENMSLSQAHIPAVAQFDECDITELEKFRQSENKKLQAKQADKLTLTVFVLKAVASGLKEYPQFNASIDENAGEIIYKRYFNIGVAVATDRGLIVPVIRDVERKNIFQLAAELAEVVQKTRQGKIELDQLHGGTFTITNPGPMGGTGMVPMINFPEVAILGMARADLKPVVRDNVVTIRRILPLALSFDHRVTDGAEAAYFVTHLINYLSNPSNFKV